MEPTSPPAGPKKRRWRRWIVGSLLVFTVLLLTLVTLLPTIASSGPVRRRIAEAVGERLGTEVTVESISLSWFGNQAVTRLRVASPPGSGTEDDLCRVERITVETGLLGLVLSSDSALHVRIQEPAVRIARDAEGRFNFEDLLPKKATESPGEPEAPTRRDDETTRSVREVVIEIDGGHVEYSDAVLDTRATLADLTAEIRVDLAGTRIEADAAVLEGEDGPGLISLSAELPRDGSQPAAPATATATVRKLDLRPFRALLETYAGVIPPDSPIDGTIRTTTGDDGTRVTGDLNVGFAQLTKVDLTVPPEEGQGDAVLQVPWSLDLGQTLTAFRPRLQLPEGSHLAGNLKGTLSVSAPLTVADLSGSGLEGKALTIALDVEGDGLDVLWPRAASPEGDEPTPPLRLQRDQVKLSLRAIAGREPDTVSLEWATLSAMGLSVRLSATVKPGSPEIATLDESTRTIDASLSAAVSIPEIVAWLGVALPAGVEVSPDASFRVDDMTLSGHTGPPDDSGAWEMQGKFRILGRVRYGGIVSEGLAGDARFADKQLALSATTLRINGGTITADELALGLSSPTEYRVALHVDGVEAHQDMAPLLAYVLPFLSTDDREAVFDGTIRSSVEIQGKGFGLDDLRNSLRGQGSLRVAGGRILASPFFRELATLVRLDFDRVLFEEIGSDFTVGDGKVEAAKLFLLAKADSKLRDLGFRGSTTFDGRLDYGVDLGALKDSVGDKRLRRVLEYAGKFLGKDGFPVRLAGTLAQPKLSLATNLEGLDLGGIDVGGLLEGLGVGGKQAPPKDVGENAQKPETQPKKPEQAIEEGLRDLLDILKAR